MNTTMRPLFLLRPVVLRFHEALVCRAVAHSASSLNLSFDQISKMKSLINLPLHKGFIPLSATKMCSSIAEQTCFSRAFVYLFCISKFNCKHCFQGVYSEIVGTKCYQLREYGNRNRNGTNVGIH